MDALTAHGVTIAHGDLNARMGTKFIYDSTDIETDSHGRIWNKLLQHTA